ncbi:hypothetical protein DFH09DRAFT_1283268 [Mycena vulgaris]|nr:hypothetical protein DFH09DRAFT_1283268 [Mycena vulgaris]
MERDAAWMPPYRPLAAFSSSSSSEENDMDQVKMMRRERDRRLKLGRGDDDGEDAEGQSGQGEGADDCTPTDLHRVNLGVMRAVDDISVYGACGREMLTQALVSFVHARVVALFSTSRSGSWHFACGPLRGASASARVRRANAPRFPLPIYLPLLCPFPVPRCRSSFPALVCSTPSTDVCSALWIQMRRALPVLRSGVSSAIPRDVQDLSEEDKSEADEELSGNAPQDDLRPSLFQI